MLNTYGYWIIPQDSTVKRLRDVQRRWREADYGLGQALMVLHDLLGLVPYVPRPPSERLRTWRDRVRPLVARGVSATQTAGPRNPPLPEPIRGRILERLGKDDKL